MGVGICKAQSSLVVYAILEKILLVWHRIYPRSFINKPLLKRAWYQLPKFLCWKIWLAWNKAILSKELATPRSVENQAHGLLFEVI
jgi:hypothetical protein